ncbi:MAG: redoxin domain-containing protein [Prevotellaceae bacterium]|jgi:thiol-disulfide isomerase/thioredoxin|nr:redoxin domain-containing protein [Prevotellaceae bacterium]
MKRTLFLLTLAALCTTIARAQYEIKVQVEGVKDSNLYLGYSYEDKRYVIDTSRADKNGKAIFKKGKPLDKGVYFIALPDHNFFEMLMTDNQQFSVVTKRPQLFDNVKFTGSLENQEFVDYQRFLGRQQKKVKAIQDRLKKNEEDKKDSVEIYRKQLEDVDSGVKEYIKKLIANNENNFLGTLMKSLESVEAPEIVVPESIANKDSVRQVYRYGYTRDHYFDNFNFADNGLIRTPFFKARIEYFFKNLIVPAPDTIIKYADMIIERSKANQEMFRYVTEYFFQTYQKSELMSHDAIVVHFADKYYLSGQAYWADADYKKKIKERVDKLRPNLVGKVAPELTLQNVEGQYISLRKLRADFTILYFWEPGCGHCKKETPKLWEYYQTIRDKGVEVYAVYTQYKREDWIKYLDEHQYDWVNVWDGIEGKDEKGKQTTFSLGSNFRDLYDVYSTPTVYLLDKNKKILAKRIDVEVVQKMIEEEMKKKK